MVDGQGGTGGEAPQEIRTLYCHRIACDDVIKRKEWIDLEILVLINLLWCDVHKNDSMIREGKMLTKSPRVKPLMCILMFTLVVLFAAGSLSGFSQAAEGPKLFRGQTIYVPVYSNIYIGDRELPWNLSVNLSVRNTDPENPITVTAVDCYNSEGRLAKRSRFSSYKE